MTKQDQRFHAAVAAMQGLLANPGGPIQANGMSGWGFCNCDGNQVAEVAVSMADTLLAELDRTTVVKESLTTEPEYGTGGKMMREPQPDADGWIPHRPGDAMPKDAGQAKDTKGAIYEDDANVGNPEYWTDQYPWPFIAWKPLE